MSAASASVSAANWPTVCGSFGTNTAAQFGTELLHLRRRRADEFGGLTEGLVKRQLLQDRAQPPDGLCTRRLATP
jgi:hypothetical protein